MSATRFVGARRASFPGLLLGALLVAGIASSAQASQFSFQFGYRTHSVHGSPVHRHRVEFRSDYSKGFERGWSRGERNGYLDGLSGRPYCNHTPRDFSCDSREFQIGFTDGFTRAYRDAYENGRRQRFSGPKVRWCR